MSTRERYPSDLTDLQWDSIGHLFPQGNGKTGRPRTYPVQEVVNAALYLARSGCTWRMLPHIFPPWKAVRYDFDTWRDGGGGSGCTAPRSPRSGRATGGGRARAPGSSAAKRALVEMLAEQVVGADESGPHSG